MNCIVYFLLTSTVGFPLESRISRALTPWICAIFKEVLICLTFLCGATVNADALPIVSEYSP